MVIVRYDLFYETHKYRDSSLYMLLDSNYMHVYAWIVV